MGNAPLGADQAYEVAGVGDLAGAPETPGYSAAASRRSSNGALSRSAHSRFAGGSSSSISAGGGGGAGADMPDCTDDAAIGEDGRPTFGSEGSADHTLGLLGELERRGASPARPSAAESLAPAVAVTAAAARTDTTAAAAAAPPAAASMRRGLSLDGVTLGMAAAEALRPEESRPPPLMLDSRNSEDPSVRTAASAAAAAAAAEAGAANGSSSSDAAGQSGLHRTASFEGDSNGRGAHVDVSVFKYQPGVQAPVENFQSYRINLRGAALTGGLMPSGPGSSSGEGGSSESGGGSRSSRNGHLSGAVDIASEYERRKGAPVERHHIKDHRAKQLLVVPNDDKFVAVAAPEAFSRHSGTCMILGGQGAYSSGPNKSYELRVGSFLRIGSVGVVVSETHTGPGGVHKCLSWEELTCLKGDIAAIQKDLVTVEALTAQEEGLASAAAAALARAAGAAIASPAPVADRKMCYMCFDDEDEAGNPLVAPCECKGDTRYVHLNCLQKWHTTTSENKVCVVLNNKGVRVCTVCKSPYKASVRLPTGESVSLFQSPLPPPYICFMVVTKHQNNEDLFSTKYQLSFASVVNRSGTGSTRGLIVGRSRQCDMVLDYRTVSTRHAMIKFAGGGFHFSDLMSSNGSYLYLREPLQLPYGETVYLKWGSNVVSLKAKRSIRHRLSNLVGRRSGVLGGTRTGSTGSSSAAGSSTVADFSMLESLCEMGQSPTAAGAAAAAAAGGGGSAGGSGALVRSGATSEDDELQRMQEQHIEEEEEEEVAAAAAAAAAASDGEAPDGAAAAGGDDGIGAADGALAAAGHQQQQQLHGGADSSSVSESEHEPLQEVLA